ncbi:MAG: CRTAC1 family protein, partial [Planctomycetes bacterium]|nr:CRTAC1 family protein [Planctomycetota bacterium]
VYLNRGDGTFRDATAEVGAAGPGWGFGCAAADIDDDGDRDILVTRLGRCVFLRNDGGKLVEVPGALGIDHDGWSTGASFGDVDGDGRLDVYIARDLTCDPKDPEVAGGAIWRGHRVYRGPLGLPPLRDFLYRNEDGKRFRDISAASGILDPKPAYGLGSVIADLDADGRPEIYVSNDSVENFLFQNLGRATGGGSGPDGPRFREIALAAGTALSEDGLAQAGMGIAIGDDDGDLLPDIFVANFSHDHNTLYLNRGGLVFEEATFRANLGIPSFRMLTFGAGLADFDNDGDLDLFVANGHVYPAAASADLGEIGWAQTDQVFLNDGRGIFREATDEIGLRAVRPRASRGAAFGDIDGDGDIDIAVAAMDDDMILYRNDGGNRNHWIRLRLEGDPARGSNRDAIGASIIVRAGGRAQLRQVIAGGSYMSASDLRIHVGLGSATAADAIEVRWPGGGRERFGPLAAGQEHAIREGAGEAIP